MFYVLLDVLDFLFSLVKGQGIVQLSEGICYQSQGMDVQRCLLVCSLVYLSVTLFTRLFPCLLVCIIVSLVCSLVYSSVLLFHLSVPLFTCLYPCFQLALATCIYRKSFVINYDYDDDYYYCYFIALSRQFGSFPKRKCSRTGSL